MEILIVAAHADDETLGCGGAIARHSAAGHEVYAVRFTDGVSSRKQIGTVEAVQRRKRAAENAAVCLGFSWLDAGDYPDNALDTVPLLEIIGFLEEAIADRSPDLVYTHHPGDLNIDHRRIFEATLTAFRPQTERAAPSIRTYEVPSSTESAYGWLNRDFQPSIYVDVASHWGAKTEALNHYEEELRESPHPRSIRKVESLARFRGAACGLELAEAFGCVREVIR